MPHSRIPEGTGTHPRTMAGRHSSASRVLGPPPRSSRPAGRARRDEPQGESGACPAPPAAPPSSTPPALRWMKRPFPRERLNAPPPPRHRPRNGQAADDVAGPGRRRVAGQDFPHRGQRRRRARGRAQLAQRHLEPQLPVGCATAEGNDAHGRAGRLALGRDEAGLGNRHLQHQRARVVGDAAHHIQPAGRPRRDERRAPVKELGGRRLLRRESGAAHCQPTEQPDKVLGICRQAGVLRAVGEVDRMHSGAWWRLRFYCKIGPPD
eukprot:scaffold2789_cov108-Isochrysis_galbana.AAC.6